MHDTFQVTSLSLEYLLGGFNYEIKATCFRL